MAWIVWCMLIGSSRAPRCRGSCRGGKEGYAEGRTACRTLCNKIRWDLCLSSIKLDYGVNTRSKLIRSSCAEKYVYFSLYGCIIQLCSCFISLTNHIFYNRTRSNNVCFRYIELLLKPIYLLFLVILNPHCRFCCSSGIIPQFKLLWDLVSFILYIRLLYFVGFPVIWEWSETKGLILQRRLHYINMFQNV